MQREYYKVLQEECEVGMTEKKELIQMPMTKIFDGSVFNLNLKSENIVLNSINVYTVYKSSIGESVPFDIQKLSKEEMRIVPHSIHNKFMIKYERLVNATKIEIKAEDIPKYKFDNNTYTFYFDCNWHLLN